MAFRDGHRTGPASPITTATMVPFIASAMTMCMSFGLPLSEDQQVAILQFAVVAIGVIQVAMGWWAAKHTTPLSDPRDRDGLPLTPEEK